MRFLQITILITALFSLALTLNNVKQLNGIRNSLGQTKSELRKLKSKFASFKASKWPKFYDANGKLLFKPEGNRLIIDHEEIPGMMPSMIMSYEVENPKQAERLEPGDKVKFKLKETSDKLLIVNIEKAQ